LIGNDLSNSALLQAKLLMYFCTVFFGLAKFFLMGHDSNAQRNQKPSISAAVTSAASQAALDLKLLKAVTQITTRTTLLFISL